MLTRKRFTNRQKMRDYKKWLTDFKKVSDIFVKYIYCDCQSFLVWYKDITDFYKLNLILRICWTYLLALETSW